MLNLKKKNFFILTFVISLFALISAYFIEYILGYQPCNLCLIERIPYMGALIIIIINYKFNHLEKYLILLLVFIFLAVLVLTYKKLQFSDLSYLLIFIYLLLHVYGSKYTYAENPFGYWLQDFFDLGRNHYDRIVHFSFGFLLAYPMRELFLVGFKFPNWVSWTLPIEITLSIGAFYELIEWSVADLFFKEQGAAYLGIQGDIWDAQKDIFLKNLEI